MSVQGESNLRNVLIGRRVVAADADDNTLTLDNGQVLRFREYEDCCAGGVVERLATFDNVITDVIVREGQEDHGDYIGIYVLSQVSTDTELAYIVENEGSGYYAYGVQIALDDEPIFATGNLDLV